MRLGGIGDEYIIAVYHTIFFGFRSTFAVLPGSLGAHDLHVHASIA